MSSYDEYESTKKIHKWNKFLIELGQQPIEIMDCESMTSEMEMKQIIHKLQCHRASSTLTMEYQRMVQQFQNTFGRSICFSTVSPNSSLKQFKNCYQQILTLSGACAETARLSYHCSNVEDGAFMLADENAKLREKLHRAEHALKGLNWNDDSNEFLLEEEHGW